MKNENDEKLLMIYFNEASQKDIDDCLKSKAQCEQLDQLEADMSAIEQAQNQHQLPADYGQQLWQKIADQLEQPAAAASRRPWLASLREWFLVPQYSIASMALVLGLVLTAFWAGRNQTDGLINDTLQSQLLAQNIQLHLTQSEIFLTQVKHGTGSIDQQATAQRLLSSNRIFKQALANQEGHFTNQLLQDLEPILVEYANGAPATSGDQNQQPKANWVSDQNARDLMFQIKTMKRQLAQKNDII